jgi:uncharacterized protein
MKRAVILTIAALAVSGLAVGMAAAQGSAAYEKAYARAMELANTDRAAAVAVLEPLAKAGDGEALNALAMLVEVDGPGWKGDPERANALREEAVKHGSSTAALNLALRTIEGPEADPARTIELLKLADKDANLADITPYLWGRLYLFGAGVERDMTRGVDLLDRFVAKGKGDGGMMVYANYLLGRAYDNGWGVEVSEDAAYFHMRAAADGGDERAQWYAAMMLLNGAGVAQDEVEAYRLVALSSEQDYMAALISRAVMLAMGQGVTEDDAEARNWYRVAAQRGSAHALRSLGGMLARGEGGPVDGAQGLAMLELAAEAGDEIAPEMIERLAPTLRLKRGDIDMARTAWLVKHGPPDSQ